MNNDRFNDIVNKLNELTATGFISPTSGSEINWRNSVKFSPFQTGATLDELREVGTAYGLYLHHCSHCDGWYFAWFKTLEQAREWERHFQESKSGESGEKI